MESPLLAAGGAVSNVPSTTTTTTTITAHPSPHLKKVLSSYQSAATRSLSGPNEVLLPTTAVSVSDLLHYPYANLPLVVGSTKAGQLQSYSAGSVKDEPMDDYIHSYSSTTSKEVPSTWPSKVDYDEFKVLKLKRPACSSLKGAVDLSPGRDKLFTNVTHMEPVTSMVTAVDTKPRPSTGYVTAEHQVPVVHVTAGQSLLILSVADRGWGHAERSETRLEGQRIACFIVGGEPRLCLPQVLNSVLRQKDITEINGAWDELQINCSLCTTEQLNSLKAQPAILPRTAASCGLITKSDAQRLCSSLLRRTAANPNYRYMKGESASASEFRVYHQCFGKCEGLCKPELYSSPDAACIECIDCKVLLNPADFVSHAHRAAENRTCHWGFDSDNWRSYLLLARRQQQLKPGSTENLLRQLDEFKNRYLSPTAPPLLPITSASVPLTTTMTTAIKRKLQLQQQRDDGEPDKTRYMKEFKGATQRPLIVIADSGSYSKMRESPPPLQEPSSSRIRHDETGHPNVALAPPHRHLQRPLSSAPVPPSSYHLSEAPRQQPNPSLGNPEIELSSTDTEDSDSVPSRNGDDCKRQAWELPAHLSDEIDSVEELLHRGGCDSINGQLILQAFRRLCTRLSWAQERQQRSPPPTAVLKLRTDLTEHYDEKSHFKST